MQETRINDPVISIQISWKFSEKAKAKLFENILY